MHHEKPTFIVLRLPRSQKGRYVAASRAAGTTLAAWITAALDAASAPFPAPQATGPDPDRIPGNPPAAHDTTTQS